LRPRRVQPRFEFERAEAVGYPARVMSIVIGALIVLVLIAAFSVVLTLNSSPDSQDGRKDG
jgi:hypothetical protein